MSKRKIEIELSDHELGALLDAVGQKAPVGPLYQSAHDKIAAAWDAAVPIAPYEIKPLFSVYIRDTVLASMFREAFIPPGTHPFQQVVGVPGGTLGVWATAEQIFEIRRWLEEYTQ